MINTQKTSFKIAIPIFALLFSSSAFAEVDYVTSLKTFTTIVQVLVNFLYILAASRGFISIYSLLMQKYIQEQQIIDFGLKLFSAFLMIFLSMGLVAGTIMSDFNLNNDFMQSLGVVQPV